VKEERFERDLRDVLLEDGQGAVSPELRERVATVSRSHVAPGRGRIWRLEAVVSSIAAAMVILIVGGLLLVTRPTPGPAAIGSASPSSTASAPSPAATPAALGQTWAAVPLTGDLAGARFAGMIAFQDGFIAVGTSGPTPGVATAWSSPDGIRWTKHLLPTPQTGPSAATQIVVGPNGPLAFGTRMNPKGETIAAVWSSPDLGGVWREADLPAPPALSSNQPGIFQPQVAASGPAGVVVVATCVGEAPGPVCPASTYLWQAADGIAWQLVTFPEDYVSLSALVAGGPEFVVGGLRNKGADPAIWTSPDGITWTSAGTLPDGGRAPNGDTLSVNAIGVRPGGIIAVSAHAGMSVIARAWASSDGRSWRVAADLSDEWFGLYRPIWTSLGFLAVGWTAPGVQPPAYPDPSVSAQHNLLRSADGIHWDVMPTPELPAGDGIGPFAVAPDRMVAATVHAILVSPASAIPTASPSGR
jgi:hypothetical protein